MDTNDSTDRLNDSPGGKVTSGGTSRRSSLRELVWGGISGLIIALALGVPVALLNNLLLCPQLRLNNQSPLIGWVGVVVSATLGVVLLVILIPAIRNAAGQDDKKHRQATIPDLRRWAKFGGVIGTFIGTGTTIYLWWVLINLFKRAQVPIESQQLVTGVYVSIGYILAIGCLGAVVPVAVFILADKAEQFTNRVGRGGKNGKGNITDFGKPGRLISDVPFFTLETLQESRRKQECLSCLP